MSISSGLGSQALLPAGLGFRNLIINGDFRVNQRSFSSTTTSGTYGFDRWLMVSNNGTTTYSAQTFTLGNAIQGYEPKNFARIVSSGQSATNAYSILIQKIEDVRTAAGTPVVISFWARAGSGTPKIAIELWQMFGTGGSPSSSVPTYAGQATLSTSWQRFTMVVNVPGIAGKTIGTSFEGSLDLNIWCSAGSDFNGRTGSLGIQSNTFDIWGVQVEQNVAVTTFEQRPIGVELDLCQRYYYKSGYVWGNVLGSGFIANNSNQFGEAFRFDFPTTMRTTPTLSYTFFNNDNAVLLSIGATQTCVAMRETCGAPQFPYSSFSFDYVVSAEI